MKTIDFYRTKSNKCPIEEFLDSLKEIQMQKVLWVLKLIEDVERVPKTYFKKLVNTDNIWEVRTQTEGNIFRLLGFFYDRNLIILAHGFQKKSQKTPQKEIKIAEERKQDFIRRHSK